MSKCYRFMLALVIVCFLGGPAAYAGIPSVSMSFDPATSTYTYTVIQGLDASDTLTDFTVLGVTAMADPYVMTNPTSGGIPVGTPPGWWNSTQTWTNPDTLQSGVEYRWYHGLVKKQPQLLAPWTGIFTLQMPGTQPVPGIVTTMGGSQVHNIYSVNVPGVVPEPSSLAALGAMLLGVGPMILRFRKR